MFRASLCTLRVWITPGPHKGWNPEAFEFPGKAMQLARASKHMTHAKLSVGTGIPVRRLWVIERGIVGPTAGEQKAIEKWLGVPLSVNRKSYVDRAL